MHSRLLKSRAKKKKRKKEKKKRKERQTAADNEKLSSKASLLPFTFALIECVARGIDQLVSIHRGKIKSYIP